MSNVRNDQGGLIMGYYVQVRKAWDELEADTVITPSDLQQKSRLTDSQIPIVRTFLSQQVSKGKAEKLDKSINRETEYRKLILSSHINSHKGEEATLESALTNEEVEGDELSITTIGESVLSIIDEYKQKIIRLREEVVEGRKQHKVIIDENLELKQALQRAQEKIIALNKELAGRGKRAVKLSDLQDLITNNEP